MTDLYIRYIDTGYPFGWRCKMKVYEVTLTTLGPVHIGNGETKKKDSYIYDRKENRVYIPDERKMIKWIVDNNLQNSYEEFFYSNKNKRKDLYTWFKINNLLSKYKNLMKYSLNTGDLSRDRDKGLNDIKVFIKGADQKPYIPGSSLKGALRNILLANDNRGKKSKYFIEYLENKIKIKELEKKAEREDKNNFKRQIDDKNSEDIMKYILISDSEPLSLEDMTIVQKIDTHKDGRSNTISVFRESIKPGVKIKFQMKLKDEFDMDIEDIKTAIEEFYLDMDFYFLQEFNVVEREGSYIYIGGGSGFVSKTVVYPFMDDRENSVKVVGKILGEKFREIKHKQMAEQNGVSPQVLKTTIYGREKMEMGLCKIDFKEVIL